MEGWTFTLSLDIRRPASHHHHHHHQPTMSTTPTTIRRSASRPMTERTERACPVDLWQRLSLICIIFWVNTFPVVDVAVHHHRRRPAGPARALSMQFPTLGILAGQQKNRANSIPPPPPSSSSASSLRSRKMMVQKHPKWHNFGWRCRAFSSAPETIH